MPIRFYLGAHQPAWLARTGVPLFVSRVRLAGRKTFPRASCRWALDSGGFSELSKHGKWTVSPEQYVSEVRTYSSEIGGMDWAAIQDHMCEPQILSMTGSTVLQHQERTVESYLRLSELAPEVPWMPVLQGWCSGDYYDHVEMYQRAGVDLAELPVVGVGSICRRQQTLRAEHLIWHLADEGIKLHGFGLKVTGLKNSHQNLVSADSMAWSFHARRERNGMQNNLGFALEWRSEMLGGL